MKIRLYLFISSFDIYILIMYKLVMGRNKIMLIKLYNILYTWLVHNFKGCVISILKLISNQEIIAAFYNYFE